MGSMRVEMALVFAQDVQEVGDLDAVEHDGEAGVGEDGIEQGRVLAVAIAEKVLHAASGVLGVHGEVAGGLGEPGGAGVGGDAEDTDAAGS
jgi:hypothetical protein